MKNTYLTIVNEDLFTIQFVALNSSTQYFTTLKSSSMEFLPGLRKFEEMNELHFDLFWMKNYILLSLTKIYLPSN